MGTSCCPAWSVMAKKLHPDHAHCISMALTPMTLTARLIKHEHPNAKVVFIGPCAAKKLEAMRKSVRSEVDFVLTFEEMAGIFAAKHVDLTTIEEDPGHQHKDGDQHAVGAAAVVAEIQQHLAVVSRLQLGLHLGGKAVHGLLGVLHALVKLNVIGGVIQGLGKVVGALPVLPVSTGVFQGAVAELSESEVPRKPFSS